MSDFTYRNAEVFDAEQITRMHSMVMEETLYRITGDSVDKQEETFFFLTLTHHIVSPEWFVIAALAGAEIAGYIMGNICMMDYKQKLIVRIKRNNREIIQFGLPTFEDRLIAAEEIIIILKDSLPPGQRKKFEDLQAKMDDLDVKHPKQ